MYGLDSLAAVLVQSQSQASAGFQLIHTLVVLVSQNPLVERDKSFLAPSVLVAGIYVIKVRYPAIKSWAFCSDFF
jgi:hypothetical protein